MKTQSVYADLGERKGKANRPWIAINMVCTIDGKILTGSRNENVMDLGSKTDHATMRFIESSHDAVMIGAGSLRATAALWYPKELTRFVVSQSGDLDFNSRFFTDAPERAIVVCPESTSIPKNLNKITSKAQLEWPEILQIIKHDYSINFLLVEGGSKLNASILALDLVDEIFLTIAPKIRLGEDIPTIADGTPFDRDEITEFRLVSCIYQDDEVFLRYHRR